MPASFLAVTIIWFYIAYSSHHDEAIPCGLFHAFLLLSFWRHAISRQGCICISLRCFSRVKGVWSFHFSVLINIIHIGWQSNDAVDVIGSHTARGSYSACSTDHTAPMTHYIPPRAGRVFRNPQFDQASSLNLMEWFDLSSYSFEDKEITSPPCNLVSSFACFCLRVSSFLWRDTRSSLAYMVLTYDLHHNSWLVDLL